MKTINDIANWLTTGIPGIILSLIMIFSTIGLLIRILNAPHEIPISKETEKKLREITPPGMRMYEMVDLLIKEKYWSINGRKKLEEEDENI